MNTHSDAHEVPAAGPGRIELRLLGPLEVVVDGVPAPLGTPKQRALLALLALRANEAVPVERLIDALWPDDPPASSRHAIQVYVSRLRGALGGSGRIEARSRAYVLHVEPGEIDLGEFRRLVREAREALAGEEPSRAGETLREALALWRGRALADLAGEPSLRDVVLELDEARVEAIELWVESELEAGRAGELVGELEALVAEYPARESLHADLMLALHRAGRTDDALEAYQRARDSLLDELGLEPSAHLLELEAAILRRDPALLPERPELRARLHLPAQPNELIGRERAVDDVVEVFAGRASRLVTLTGAGGIGKTRLALAVAERLALDFEDGVWFVDLSAVSDPSLVLPAVAQTLGVAESQERPSQVAVEEHLADKHVLLVLDNFEQVSDAAPSVSNLIRQTSRVAVLVTSRVPLHLFGEEEYEVPTLSVPDRTAGTSPSALGEAEAVRLFVARARAVFGEFELDEGNAREIADVCIALGGLPLAIELAGATAKDLTPSELRDRLETSLDFLVGGPVDSPARQQTMRATIEWSCGLLGPDEQRQFAPLAVFSGGWTAEAALEVCGTTTATLSSLREKGMVYSAGGRFGMLTPIREFALETMTSDEARALARKHAEYFADRAEIIESRVSDHGLDLEYLNQFGREQANFWAALRSAHAAGEKELFARLAAAIGPYSYVRGHYREARHWLEIAFADPPEDPAIHGRVARGLGMVSSHQGDYARTAAVYARGVELFRSIGDTEMEAKLLYNTAAETIRLGDYERGQQLLMECRERARTIDDERKQARLEQFVVNALGVVHFMEDRPREAESWFAECLAICERLREREGAATALMNLGIVALQLDRLDDAAARLREGLRLAAELQKLQTIANCVVGLAGVAVQVGEPTRAGRLLGIVQRLLDESGAQLEPYHARLFDETLTAIQADAGAEAEEAFALGRRSERDDAVAYALEA